MTLRVALPLLALATCLASGCGLRGDLERPAPIWGNPPLDGPTDPRVKAKAEADKAAAEKAAAEQPAPTPSPAAPEPAAQPAPAAPSE